MNEPKTEETRLNILVEKFSQEMRAKVLTQARQGYRGWDGMCEHEIKLALLEHVEKNQPIDVAILAAFWWHEEEGR